MSPTIRRTSTKGEADAHRRHKERRGAGTAQRAERGEDGEPLVEVDVANLPAVAAVPAQGRPPETVGRLDEKEAELERLGEPDMLELGGGRERLGDVAAVESAAEASER